MKKVFFLAALAIMGAVTAAVALTSDATMTRSPVPLSTSSPTFSPTPSAIPSSSSPTHSVPTTIDPRTLTGTPGQTWIGVGPGDDVCHAPGDCGYGDNPDSQDDGIPNNTDH